MTEQVALGIAAASMLAGLIWIQWQASMRAPTRVLGVELGREPTRDELARVRRLRWINAASLLVAVGSIAAVPFMGWTAAVLASAATFVSLIAFRWAQEGLKPTESSTSRFRVELEEPPRLASSLSRAERWGLVLLHVGVVGGVAALHGLSAESAPPDWRGHVGYAALLLLNGAVLLAWLRGRSDDRIAHPDGESALEYAPLRREHRQLMLKYWLHLGAGLAAFEGASWLLWTASHVPSLGELPPFWPAWAVAPTILVSVMSWRIGTRLRHVQAELRRLGGLAIGTRREGWRFGGLVYWSTSDPAAVVTRPSGGVALNFGRPRTWLALVGGGVACLGVAWLPALL